MKIFECLIIAIFLQINGTIRLKTGSYFFVSIVIISCSVLGFFIAFYLDAFILEQKELSFKNLNDQLRDIS